VISCYATDSSFERVLATKMILNPFYENFMAIYFPIPSDAPVMNTHDPGPYFDKLVLGFNNFHKRHSIFKHLSKVMPPNI
jgi:hypothetical protein